MGMHATGPLLLTVIALALPVLGSVSDCAVSAGHRRGDPEKPAAAQPSGDARAQGRVAEARPSAAAGAAAHLRMDDRVPVAVVSGDATSNGDFDASYRTYLHMQCPASRFVTAGALAGGAHGGRVAVAIRPRWLQP